MAGPSTEAILETLGVDRARQLSEAPTRRLERRRRRSTRQTLEELRDRHARGALSYDLGETLGVGGEGVVRRASQPFLSRQVAVKKLRADRQSDEAEQRLLIEAWIAGLLEHPNIVPIYDIRIDDDGDLLIVYKKIDGQSWAETIGRERAARESLLPDFAGGREARPLPAKSLSEADHLERNLSVLIRVCDAVAYAHDRGIVHRDLKPANILLGDFGEVYLTDWGIAAAIDDRHGPRIPLLAEDHDIIGTPAYMAPEMLWPERGEIGTATDVYQLGAMLYECVSGRAPHATASLDDTIESIRSGPPALGDGAPPRLRAICERAMARRPDDRHGSVAELRRELEGFLRQRGLYTVLDGAGERLEQLRARIAEAGADESARNEIYRLVAECRFGFSEALGELPELAGRGLRDTATALIDYELERGAPDAAQAALAELESYLPEESLPPALVERIERAARERRAADAELHALARLGRRHRPEVGQGARKLFAVMMAVSVLFPTAARLVAWYGFAYRLPPLWGVVSAIISLAPVLLFYLAFRADIRESALTRAAAIGLAIGIVMALVLSALTLALSWNPGLARLIYLFFVSGLAASFALYFLPGLMPSAIMYLICATLVALDRENVDYRDWLTLLSNATLVVNALWLWWPRREVSSSE